MKDSINSVNHGNMVKYLGNYVKGVQTSRKKGMIETQSGKVNITCRDIDGKKISCHLKAIRVRNGEIQIAYSDDYGKKFEPVDFKKDESWKNIYDKDVVFEPTLMTIVGNVTNF